jgi:endogenous inhibitor of DNA gyrase (YacG/DUF329 family)
MRKNVLGLTYRCPVCGAELAVVSRRIGAFVPFCCNTSMVPVGCTVTFYVCPVCGAEVGLLRPGADRFQPECCNRPMVRILAEAA